MAPAATLPVETALNAPRRDQVEQLLTRAAAADGFGALNEAAEFALRDPTSVAIHLTVGAADRVVGYAQLDPGTTASTGFLLVDPTARRRGLGVRLALALAERAPTPMQLLAPTDSPAAQALAARLDLVAVRTLLIMTRDLGAPLPEPEVPPGITIRPFRPGQDEAAWLAVNAAAFASHPEQGAVTAADLAERMAEPWFDPAGFLVAEQDADLVGFHWTKQHEGRLGEVYVLGVSPKANQQGLGKALLLAGLRHLQGRGNTAVELYVEAASGPAIGLYSRYGFTAANRDVMYAQRPIRAPQES